MAPHRKRPLKSYSRNVSYNRSAANILQNILTNPIEKKKNRRKPKIEIKELPPLNKDICFSNQSDSQMEVNFNNDNTFDRLLKGPNYKEVNFKTVLKNNSSSESSLSLLHIKRKRSPNRKRRIVKVRTRSPVVTRSISLQNSPFNINECNPHKEDENKRLRTQEVSVNESLCIEKVQAYKQKSTIHFNITFDNKSNSIRQQREEVKGKNSNLSFEQMFSKTFTERYGNNLNMPLFANAISSTPVVPILDQRLVNETTISPIVNLDTEKFESNMTPKLRHVSKIRRSRLLLSVDYQNSMLGQESIIENNNEICQNAVLRENVVLNNRNKEKTNNSSSELVSNNKQNVSNAILSTNLEKLIQNDTVKDLSKQLENAVMSVTLLNMKRLGAPFINLTNIQIGPFRNKFSLNDTENSMLTKFDDYKVAVCNVTFVDFERYLYHLNKHVSKEVLHKKDDSETQNVSKIYRKPLSDITNINIKKYISSECSKSEGDIEQDVNLIFTTTKHNTPPYITLRRRKVPKAAPIKRSKSSRKAKSVESKSAVTNDFESSESIVIIGDEESANFRNISAENYTGLEVESGDLDGSSINVKRLISEDKIHEVTPKSVSPDLFKSSSLSTKAQSVIQSPEAKEDCLQSPTNRSVIILDGNSANSVDPSILDPSFVDFTCKSTMGFPFKTGKRSRVSQFKQCTKAHNDQSINRSSLLIDVIENTPINIIKREKLSCALKKNIITIDLGKERSRRTNRAIKHLDLQPGVVQTELNDLVVGDCNLKSSSTPKTCQTSKRKSKKSLRRSDFQPDTGEIEVKDQIKDGYVSECFTASQASVASKRQFKISLKNSDFQCAIDPSKINEQLIRDNDSVAKKVPKISKEESRKSSKKQDLQPMPEELVCDTKADHRGSNAFAVPKLPVLKKDRNPIDNKIILKPGKLWRRSLIEIRNSKIGLPSDRQSLIYKGGGSCACEVYTPRRSTIRVIPLADLPDVTDTKSNSVLENYAISCRKSSYLPLNNLRKSSLEHSLGEVSFDKEEVPLEMTAGVSLPLQEVAITAREVVLRKCGQSEPIPFRRCYSDSILQNCRKIGEGVYGEVFLFRHPRSNLTTVIKIIPIEGNLIVNGERQKKFEEILSEITIAMELSNLRTNSKNTTNCFNELTKVNCVQGKYPRQLLKLWKSYNETKGSENDDPEMFDENQLYISLELANGGNSMESFVFNNSQQAYSLVTQMACALSVAENSLEFEHRDLHWGNVLVSNTDNDDIAYNLDGKCLKLPSHGIQVAIIDFTLSRISHVGVCLYNDLSADPDLFTATGDYQFEIYRLMKKYNKNDWQRYQPYTNILWLHYIVDKTINGVRYRNKTSKTHKHYLRQLKELHSTILQYKSVNEFVASKFF